MPTTHRTSAQSPISPVQARKVGLKAAQPIIEKHVVTDISVAAWEELGNRVRTLNQVSRHALVSKGVSTKVLFTLLDSFERISKPEIFAVVGFSSKTAGRRKDTAMSLPVSDATVSLIEIKSLAESVLGSSANAEDWLNKPALALDGYKPMELIATRSGAEMVKELLIRLDYGVTV